MVKTAFFYLSSFIHDSAKKTSKLWLIVTTACLETRAGWYFDIIHWASAAPVFLKNSIGKIM